MGSESFDSDPNVLDARARYDCEGEVQYLYVAPGARRRGIAAQLLRILADWFDQRAIRRVCVNADIDSPGATSFYLAARARPLNRHWYVWDDIRIASSANGEGGVR